MIPCSAFCQTEEDITNKTAIATASNCYHKHQPWSDKIKAKLNSALLSYIDRFKSCIYQKHF